jgi:hypothetical protein
MQGSNSTLLSTSALLLLIDLEGEDAPHKFVSSSSNLSEFMEHVKTNFKIDSEFTISYFDTDFQEWVALDDFKQLKSRAKIRVHRKKGPKRKSHTMHFSNCQ